MAGGAQRVDGELVALVGAGPGAVALRTLRAARLIAAADAYLVAQTPNGAANQSCWGPWANYQVDIKGWVFAGF